jgi:hypothetical protein
MPAYIVRYNARHDTPGNLLGIFVAYDEEELHYFVDQKIEPNFCEYLELESGGIAWDSETNFPVPYPEDTDYEMTTGLPAGGSLAGSWKDVLFEPNTAEWVPLITKGWTPFVVPDLDL